MKKIQAVIAIALWVIALNMTYSNFNKGPVTSVPVVVDSEEKVLPVIGRVSVAFDGLGAEVGFLVQDGQNLKLLPFDQGSLASNPAYQPKYLKVTRFADGHVVMDSLQVAKIN